MAHILLTVAERLGHGDRVYTRPYALTWWEYIELQEADRIAEILAQGTRIVEAGLTSKAFNDPSLLREDIEKLNRDAGLDATPEQREAEIAAATAEADAILAEFEALASKAKVAR